MQNNPLIIKAFNSWPADRIRILEQAGSQGDDDTSRAFLQNAHTMACIAIGHQTTRVPGTAKDALKKYKNNNKNDLVTFSSSIKAYTDNIIKKELAIRSLIINTTNYTHI